VVHAVFMSLLFGIASPGLSFIERALSYQFEIKSK